MPEPEEVADFVAQKALEHPNVQKVVADVRVLDGLREHVGWRWLAERVRRDKERCGAELARRLMAGAEVPQREIDYNRGFYAGAEWIIEHPEEAEKSLERAARRAWLMVQDELAAEVLEDSPYVDPPQTTSSQEE